MTIYKIQIQDVSDKNKQITFFLSDVNMYNMFTDEYFISYIFDAKSGEKFKISEKVKDAFK